MSVEDLLAGLNPQQREAVQCTEGPLLVLAGAGSGKTRVLTHRVAWLIGACGIAPESILAVTFTNKAAGEMRGRVEKLLGPAAREVWLSTFHSSCARILRRDIPHLERRRDFAIYDDADSLATAKQVLKSRNLPAGNPEARRLRWQIDQWKNAGLRPEDAAERARDFEAEQSAELYGGYQRLLVRANALDFGDLLLCTTLLFRQHPQVLEHYRERWQYILVDEYQDTNHVQYQLVNLLAGEHRNLCVVGDPDQSIYAWRGANIRNILHFERDYNEARVVKLEQNYRSTQHILSGAGAVVANNTGRPDKQMVAVRGDGEKISLYEARDDRDEARFVVKSILALQREEQRAGGDFAVFYRTNAQSRPIEEELLRCNLPYVVVGGVRFYERAEVKDALAYLRLLVNRADNQALRRIIGRPARGIGRASLDRAQTLADQRGLSLFEGLRLLAGAGGRSAAPIRGFIELMESLARDAAQGSPADGLSLLLDRSGYLHALRKESTPDAEARHENLRELIASAEDFAETDAGANGADGRSAIGRFLDQVALVSDIDNANLRSESVSLMTVHSAKGLEFPVVFLAGLEEDLFPHKASSYDEDKIAEERRLCYVGMTRAMERLTLTYAQERRRFGSHTYAVPSRFLAEIPAEFLAAQSPGQRLTHAHDRSYAHDPADSDYDQTPPPPPGETPDAVRPGSRVRHPLYGPGEVLEVTGQGPRQKLRIRFDRFGVKKIVARYANLQFG